MKQGGPVRWTQRALRDLVDIDTFIGARNPSAAEVLIRRIRRRARDVVPMPSSGRRVPEAEDPAIREVFVGNYRIIYRVMGRNIAVLTVIEGHRMLHAADLEP